MQLISRENKIAVNNITRSIYEIVMWPCKSYARCDAVKLMTNDNNILLVLLPSSHFLTGRKMRDSRHFAISISANIEL